MVPDPAQHLYRRELLDLRRARVSLSPDTDLDVAGVVHRRPGFRRRPMPTRSWSRSKPLSQAALFFAMCHSSNVGPTGTDVITFHLAGFRPATIGEIAAGNQVVQALPVFPLLPGVTPDVEKAADLVDQGQAGFVGLWSAARLQWPYPIWNFSLRYEVLRDRALLDEVKGVWELFNTVQGQYAPWLFLDQGDYAVTGASFGVGDGRDHQLPADAQSAQLVRAGARSVRGHDLCQWSPQRWLRRARAGT